MKQTLKFILNTISRFLTVPAGLLFRLQSKMSNADAAITSWSQAFSLLPGKTGLYLRHAFFRSILNRCDVDAHIGFGTILSHSQATIGRSVYIGNYCSIGDAHLDDDVLVASHVSIMNGTSQHGLSRLDIPVREQPGIYPPITIGRDTWIGERAIVAASVGKHCVVGAGALVLEPLPDYAIAVGTPARIIGDRRKLAAKARLSRSDNVPEVKSAAQPAQ